MTKQGLAAIVATRGNPQCHIILRGGSSGPNYSEAHLADAARSLEAAGLRPTLMVDCSHADGGKDPARQPAVAEEIARQLRNGGRSVFGIMIESFLMSGRQDVKAGAALNYGQSITDGCLGFAETRPVLEQLAEAVNKRQRV